MKEAVLLFVFIFSPVIIVAGSRGRTETGQEKLEVAEVIVPAHPKTLEQIILQAFSNWQEVNATWYDPMDPKQTRKNPDGRGAFGRMIKSGSIAFGSAFTEIFRLEKMLVYVETRDLNIMTPYGLGIFRVDDKMANESGCRIDFFQGDLNQEQKIQLKNGVTFRICRIEKVIN